MSVSYTHLDVYKRQTFDDLYSRQLCVFDLFVFSVPRVRLCSPVDRTSADA